MTGRIKTNTACFNILDVQGGAENGVDNVAAVAADCLHDDDLQILVKLESELRRSDGNDYDQIFPCIDCATYFKLFSVNGLVSVVIVFVIVHRFPNTVGRI
mgnify:FL=1